MKNLPIGVSTFESIITSNALYVDKTEHIYKLLKPNSRYFLSRPRRFGKSLTCSTLEAIFSGNKELFKGLWLAQSDYTWKQHPVIYLDMSEISYDSPEDLRESLHEKLNYIAKTYGVDVESRLLKTKLTNLIIKLYEKLGPVVVLIDEYDKPIIEHVDNLHVADKMRTILRGLYGAFKGTNLDKHLHFLFITGVSKFAKVSLFSEVNNLQDLTTTTIAAALVGYTDHNLDHYLAEHIQAFANATHTNYAHTRSKLKTWYNGYQFSEDSTIKVYNPFSLHNCLTDKKLTNYWFSSGTPTVLMKIIAKEPKVIRDFISQETIKIAESGMEDFSIEVYYKKIVTLLLQTGYLTIKSYDSLSRNYTLDYPNLEVRYSMTEQIMDYVAHIPKETIGEFYARFTRALMVDNIGEYCAAFRDYLKLIPHNIIIDREKFFQATFYNTALLIDPKAVLSESATDRGYIDIVLHGATKVFIMEFKKDKTPEVAMQQIHEKKYYEKYVLQGDKVTLVGINFDPGTKKKGKSSGVDVNWIIEDL